MSTEEIKKIAQEAATKQAAEDAAKADEAKKAAEATLIRLAEMGIDATAETQARIDSLARAIELGAPQSVLRTLCDANRVSRTSTIVLPAGKYAHCSRGKDWCRMGSGSSVTWGERETGGGFRVRAGKWVVGSDDGFRRKDKTEWAVKHIDVGGEKWTIAD